MKKSYIKSQIEQISKFNPRIPVKVINEYLKNANIDYKLTRKNQMFFIEHFTKSYLVMIVGEILKAPSASFISKNLDDFYQKYDIFIEVFPLLDGSILIGTMLIHFINASEALDRLNNGKPEKDSESDLFFLIFSLVGMITAIILFCTNSSFSIKFKKGEVKNIIERCCILFKESVNKWRPDGEEQINRMYEKWKLYGDFRPNK